jgi:hypothetical protein
MASDDAKGAEGGLEIVKGGSGAVPFIVFNRETGAFEVGEEARTFLSLLDEPLGECLASWLSLRAV